MDFDLNAALNNTHIAIYAPGDRRSLAAQSSPPKIDTIDPHCTHTPAKEITTYKALSAELIQRIGEHVPLDDMGSFTAIDSRTYRLMREKRRIWRCWQRASTAGNPASLNRILKEIEAVLDEPEQRVEPFMMLQQQLRAMTQGAPDQSHAEFFKRLFLAANDIPNRGAQIQKALGSTLFYFPEPLRFELFRFMVATTVQRSSEQENFLLEFVNDWLSFYRVREIHNFVPGYQAVLARLPHLRESLQAKLILVICDIVREPLSEDREFEYYPESLYARLQTQTMGLPHSHQGAPVGALASAIEILPHPKRAARYAQIRNLALSLPDDQWGIALRSLPIGILALPPDRYVEEFGWIESALARVPLAQRPQVAFALLKPVTFIMNNTLVERVWSRALNLLDGTGEKTVYQVLNKLEYPISLMSEDEWQHVLGEINNLMARNRFSEQARAEIAKLVNYFRRPYEPPYKVTDDSELWQLPY